jgi:hypothetical protein
MYRRRAVAAAAIEAATGLEEIGRSLNEYSGRLFRRPGPVAAVNGPASVGRPVPQELFRVVHADLVDLCRAALAPAWSAAQSGRRTDAGVYAQRLEVLIGEYANHVARDGLLTAPPHNRDPKPRDQLASRVWTDSPDAQAVLRTTAGEEMTQLCRGNQVRFLSTVADPGLVRFAPAQVLQVLDADGRHRGLAADPGIVWSAGGELVGALRLLPLRLESVSRSTGGVR